MQTKNTFKGLMSAGVISAIAASLCCITPVLALIAGASGAASAFSWIEPARPYLIGLTVLVLGFAWYQKLKPRTKEEIDCACEEDEKPSFLQSKKFLLVVTVFAALMLAFPYYSSIFFQKSEKQIIVVDKNNIQISVFKISGMDCEACTESVKHEINKLDGIIKTEASFENANAEVQFDITKTNIGEIEKAINSTGYKVKHSEIKK